MNANENVTLHLPAGQVLTITASAGATGSVVRLSRVPGGGDSQSTTAIAGANLYFGPYADTERFQVFCTAGTVTYSTGTKALDTDGTLAANADYLVPTQKAVKTYVDALLPLLNAITYKGVISSLATFPAASKGDLYKCTAAGAIGGTGPTVAIGDIAICNTDSTAAGTYAEVGTKWDIIPATNIDSINDLLAATAENDVIVAGASPFAWGKKTLAEFKTILGLGTAAYTASTAYDAAGTAAGKIASSISDNDITHAPDGNSVFDALALKAPLANPAFTGTATAERIDPTLLILPDKTPINAMDNWTLICCCWCGGNTSTILLMV